MKRISTVIFISIFTLLISLPVFSKGKTIRFYVSARRNCLDHRKRGKLAFTKLNPRLKYKIKITGKAYFGKQKAKGIFLYFPINKEDSMAERYLFVKPGDYFYINPGGSRPFIVAFFMKFYSNKAAHRGGFYVTCIPVGRRQKDSQYKEKDMYKGIK